MAVIVIVVTCSRSNDVADFNLAQVIDVSE